MRKRIFLIMLGILASLAVSFGSSYAQDIDISNMDNAQLMELLQAIMQKLEEESADKSPDLTIVTTVPAAEDLPESVAETNRFRIYENKKLVVERIPDWYFIRNDPKEEPPAEEKPAEPPAEGKPTGVPDDSDDCIICPYYDIETGEGIDCFSIC